MIKNLTIRVEEELAAIAKTLARAEGKSLNELVTGALEGEVKRLSGDPGVTARLRSLIEADRMRLEQIEGRQAE